MEIGSQLREVVDHVGFVVEFYTRKWSLKESSVWFRTYLVIESSGPPPSLIVYSGLKCNSTDGCLARLFGAILDDDEEF